MSEPQDLLAVLDPNDRARAEERYKQLFVTLRRFFEWNRMRDPDDLAQLALTRGFERIQNGTSIFSADPGGYFYGIARMILLERRKARREEQFDGAEPRHSPDKYQGMNRTELAVWMRECLQTLTKEELSLLLNYIEGKPPESGISLPALRLRIHRIRKKLIETCGSWRASETKR